MKKFLLIAVFVLSIFGLKAQTFNPLLSAMLQDTLNVYVAQITNIKGMAASVYIPGQGIWTGVSGNSYAGQPITSNMRFGIASNSKLFVAVMMLKLAENNIISLDDSLKDWITVTNTNINPNITIRQLLNHTSGISDPFFVSPWFDTINNNSTRVFTPNEVLGWVGAPLFPAGSSWGYSNTNYVIAGMIAKSATGINLSKLIRDSILTPLNLNSTFIDTEEPVNGTLAHRWWNAVVNPATIDYHDTSRVGLNSAVGYAGSIFSTTSDMALWYNALFTSQVLKPSSMNQLTNFITTSNPGYQYGLGLSRELTQGLTYWGHGGRTWGYKSKMIYDTCLQVTVAGLANADPSGMDGVTFLLYRVVKNHIPGCCSAISGPVTVCEGTNSITYSIPPVGNATSYIWTLPSGVTGSSTTNSITLYFGTGAVSGTIKVTGVNNYGPGGSSSIWVTVNPKPAMPSPITRTGGSAKVCPGNVRTYSINAVAGATSYTWTPPAGAVITNGQGSTSVIVSFGPGFLSSDTLKVVANNNCGSGPVQFLKIIRNNPSKPGVISGPSYNVCNSAGQTYSVTNVTGITYNWNFNNASASVSSGQGLNNISASFNPNFITATLSVTASNACGTSAQRTLTIKATPPTPGTISGSSAVCANQQNVPFAITPVAGAVSYTWQGPTGSHISDGTVTSTSTILTTTATAVTINFAGTAGMVKVKANNACGSGSYRSLAITFICREQLPLSTELSAVTIFPNPATDQISISFDEEFDDDFNAVIRDITGKKMLEFSEHTLAGEHETSLDVSTLQNGIYFLEITRNSKQSILKLSIQK